MKRRQKQMLMSFLHAGYSAYNLTGWDCKERARPDPTGSRGQHFMAPRSVPGCSVPCLSLPIRTRTQENTHSSQGTVKGALLALLLCLQSPSTSSMPWTQVYR